MKGSTITKFSYLFDSTRTIQAILAMVGAFNSLLIPRMIMCDYCRNIVMVWNVGETLKTKDRTEKTLVQKNRILLLITVSALFTLIHGHNIYTDTAWNIATLDER